jgi:hypothetical protein
MDFSSQSKLDFSGISNHTIYKVQGQVSGPSQVNTNSIAWYKSGRDTIVIADSSSTIKGEADMEISLHGFTGKINTAQIIPDGPPASAVGSEDGQQVIGGGAAVLNKESFLMPQFKDHIDNFFDPTNSWDNLVSGAGATGTMFSQLTANQSLGFPLSDGTTKTLGNDKEGHLNLSLLKQYAASFGVGTGGHDSMFFDPTRTVSSPPPLIASSHG